MTLRSQIEERGRQFAEFNRWEEQQLEDPDPEKPGVQAMRATLAHLSRQS